MEEQKDIEKQKDKKDIIRQVVLIVLLLVVVGYAGYIYWPIISTYLPDSFQLQPKTKAAKIKRPATKAKPDQPAAKTVTDTVPVTQEGATEKKEIKADLVDPFALRINIRSKSETPKEEKKEEVEEALPELEGIWVDSGMRVAFISNQAVVEGGLVMGWRVSRITKTQVTLTKGRRRKILKLEAIQ